jgi:dienelactone hydrolase
MNYKNIARSIAFLLIVSASSTFVVAQQLPDPPEAESSSSPQGPLVFNGAPRHGEDWNAIVVDPASLQPMSYAVIGKSETADFTRELLRIQWRVADPIDLYVIKPRGVDHPPVILYLYSYPSDTERFMNDGWCKRATKGGFAAVGFVGALTGPRFMYRPMKEWFVSQLQEALGTSTHDVQMILNYLARRNDVSLKDVGMFGQGSGGAIALLAAAADSRIQVVDVVDPWGDWPDWLRSSAQVPDVERATYLKPEFLKSVENLDPVRYLPNLKLKALRVQQVMTDPVTPETAKDKIAAAVPQPSDLVRYDNEHSLMEAWRVTGLSGWMEDQMIPPSKPLAAAGH